MLDALQLQALLAPERSKSDNTRREVLCLTLKVGSDGCPSLLPEYKLNSFGNKVPPTVPVKHSRTMDLVLHSSVACKCYTVRAKAECLLTSLLVQGVSHSGIPRHLQTESCIHPSGGIVGELWECEPFRYQHDRAVLRVVCINLSVDNSTMRMLITCLPFRPQKGTLGGQVVNSHVVKIISSRCLKFMPWLGQITGGNGF